MKARIKVNTISEFFRNKTILITGATGFLGKPVVAKILADLPDIRRVYLLVRSRTGANGKVNSAADRLEDEFFTSSVFAKLRRIHGDGYDNWIREKVHAVDGDLNYEQLGMSAGNYEKLQGEVQIFINSGGLVKFDPPIDMSMHSNVLGAKYAVEFVKGCNDAVLLHVSTAYVCGTEPGRISEELHSPYEDYAQKMAQEKGEKIPDSLEAEIEDILQISEEIRGEANESRRDDQLRREALKQVGAEREGSDDYHREYESIRQKWIEQRLVDEGLKRAQSRGWNDTYTYMKALGEQMVAKTRGDLPVAIIRPSIIESSLEEPQPGWLDGLRMADPLIVGFGKGRLPDFPAEPDIILDIIPVDFVVNAILVLAKQTYQKRGIEVYHVATGSQNPLYFRNIVDASHDHFVKYPMLDSGKPIPPPVWKYPGLEEFQRKLSRKLGALKAASRMLDLIPLRWSRQRNRRIAVIQNALEGLQYYIRIYGPYTRLNFEFETSKIRQLSTSLTASDQRHFNLNISSFDWQHYLQNIHIPGIKRFILKMDADPSVKMLKEIERSNAIRHDACPREKGSIQNCQTILDLVVRQAAAYSDKTALKIERDGGWIQYSYRQLYDLSQQIAFTLWKRGYRKDDKMILISENQPEWGITYLAAIQIGVIVVPIDPQTARVEVIALADFTESKAILASDALFEQLCSITDEREKLDVLNLNQLCGPSGAGGVESPIDKIPDDFPNVDIHPDATASIIFTMGTTVDPRGAMLSHKGFVANLHAVAQVLPPAETDHILSILPLYHALGFSCSFLMAIYGGATVTYVNTFKPTAILESMRKTETTAIIGVPRLYKLLYDAIERYVLQTPIEADEAVDSEVIEQVKEALGGHIRVFVSGGAALPRQVYDGFRRFGFTILEGYGMTETAPVLSVNPAGKSKAGSVGPPVNDVEFQIVDPDANGIGEIVTKSPSTMAGYYRNTEATQQVIRDGLLYTGDLGYIDEDGYLFLTGRKKNVIIGGTGKNVYPVELEELYRHSPYISEICVVGIDLPDSFGEEVHTVIVPNYCGERTQVEVQESIQKHLQACARSLPTHQNLQKVHFREADLPKTPSRAIDRPRVKELLLKQLVADPTKPIVSAEETSTDGTLGDWTPGSREAEIAGELGRLSRVPPNRIRADSALDTDLGLDSLTRVELLLLLESKLGKPVPDAIAARIHTVGDVIDAAKTLDSQTTPDAVDTSLGSSIAAEHGELDSRPSYLAKLIRFGIRMIFRHRFSLRCDGLKHIPSGEPYIIAANHSSHLDTPAIITALGVESRKLRPLSAKDYFYNSRLKAWFVSQCLNTLPFDRTDNSLQSLRVAQESLLRNENLLIYPEGTRSLSGELQPFKPGLGLLAYEAGVPIVPAHISGTYEALPKGKSLPGKSKVSVVFGEPVVPGFPEKSAVEKSKREIYREIADEVRSRIQRLRDATHE
jgi:long-chain acyl-CoA synthetase